MSQSAPPIALLIGSLERGGAQRMLLRLMEGLEQQGFRPHLLVMDKTRAANLCDSPGQEQWLTERVTHLSNLEEHHSTFRKAVAIVFQWWKMERYLRHHQVPVVLSFMDRANILNLLSLYPQRRVLSIRSVFGVALKQKRFLKKMLIRMAFPLLLKRAYQVVFNARESERHFLEIFPSLTGKTSTLYNFYDPKGLEEAAREPLHEGKTLPKPQIVAVGRLVFAKGFDVLLRAFALLKEKTPQAQLTLLGDGPERETLAALAGKLGVAEQVVFAGFQENPLPWVREADVFVLSSRREGFPNALLEAMALGKPIISADCRSGPREILAPQTPPEKTAHNLEEGDGGFLFPPPDFDGESAACQRAAEVLAEALERVLNDADLREKLGKAALAGALRFSPATVLPKWMEILSMAAGASQMKEMEPQEC